MEVFFYVKRVLKPLVAFSSILNMKFYETAA